MRRSSVYLAISAIALVSVLLSAASAGVPQGEAAISNSTSDQSEKKRRVFPLDARTAPAGAAAAMINLPRMNILGVMAHGNELVPQFTKFADYLINHTKLDPVLREIAIIRVGVLSGADYELQQHERLARQLGMSDQLIQACREGPNSAHLDSTQRLVMAFTDDVVVNVRASDATFLPLADLLSTQELQELVVTIGFYMTVSRFVETFDVELD